jgi:ABC-type amino acid transport substrate-binding protein
VDYVVSRGPEPTPTPKPTPKPTPRPTATPAPTAEPTPEPAGDLLERIQAAGRIVVNIDPNDGPWTRIASDGTAQGFDVDIATSLAESLGVDIAFTTFPFEQAVTGGWDGRFDIAMHHLAITDSRRSVIDMSAPYAFEPSVVIVPAGSSITSIDQLADTSICAAYGSDAASWLTGTLQLTDPPVAPATAPDGITLKGTTTESTCIDEVVDGTDVAAGLIGVDDADRATADGDPIAVIGDPVYLAPIGIAYDRSGPDPASLEAELDGALEALRADGTLSERSIARFDGRDLTQAPGGGAIVTPGPGGPAAFAVDDTLVARFPGSVGDIALTPLFLSGADLDLLLRPSNTSVSRTYRPFTDLGAGTDLGIAALGLAMAPVVDGDDSAMLTAAHMDGSTSADLEAALTPLFGNQLRSDHQEAEVDLAGKSVTRTSSGSYASGDTALWVYTRDGVAWFVLGTEPLAEEVLAALPD